MSKVQDDEPHNRDKLSPSVDVSKALQYKKNMKPSSLITSLIAEIDEIELKIVKINLYLFLAA